MTATNGTPMSRAKYASLTAVEPLDASMIVVSGPIHPLHKPNKNSDLARRCFKLPVGCTDSSFKYRSTPSTGSVDGGKGGWALRLASAAKSSIAPATHARWSSEVFGTA